jgi:hypothetical protein
MRSSVNILCVSLYIVRKCHGVMFLRLIAAELDASSRSAHKARSSVPDTRAAVCAEVGAELLIRSP